MRYTVKVAKDTDRARERGKISTAKNARAYNLSFESRQSNTEEKDTRYMEEEHNKYIFRECI